MTKYELQNWMQKETEHFINLKRKICWEAEYQNGEYCIGENDVEDLIAKCIRKIMSELPSNH